MFVAGVYFLMPQKTVVLLLFYAVSFVLGAFVIALPVQLAGIVQGVSIVITTFFTFLWYRLDSNEREYPRSVALNIAIVAFSIIGFPYYLFRSRGFKRGFVALLLGISVLLGTMILSILGGMIVTLALGY
jgi:hypothetical protein